MIVAIITNIYLSRLRSRIISSESHYKGLMDGSPNGVAAFDRNGHYLSINPACLRRMGWRESDVIGKRFVDSWPLPTRPIVENALHLVLEGAQCGFEADCIKPNGIKVTWYVVLNPVFGLEGNVESIASIWTDVSEERATADALREQKVRAQTYLDAAKVIMIVIDTNGLIQMMNKLGREVLGCKKDEIIGANWFDRFVPEDIREQVKRSYTRLLSGELEMVDYYESSVITESGEQRVIAWHNTIIRDEAGRICSTLCSGEDITVRRSALEELARKAREDSALAELSEALLASASVDEISDLVLKHGQSLTGSDFGFVGYMDPTDGTLVSSTMSQSVWDTCQIPDKDIRFKSFNNLWGWVLKNRKPVLSNSPSTDERSVGVPKGHIPIEKLLAFPALTRDRLVGLIALANPGRDYTEHDMDVVARLASLYALAVQRKQMEDDLNESQSELAAIFYNAPGTLLLVDDECKVHKANLNVGRIAQVEPNELVGLAYGNALSCVHVNDGPTGCGSGMACTECKIHLAVANILETGFNSERINATIAINANGQLREMDVFLTTALFYIDGKRLVLLCIEDVTEQKRAEKLLRIQTSAMNATSDQIVITNAKGMIEFVNPAFERQTGYSFQEAAGHKPNVLKSGKQGGDFYSDLWKTINQGNTWHGEVTNRRKDGSYYTEDMTITPVRSINGSIEHFVAIKRDITDKKVYEERLDFLAYHDPLTGLPNRLLFSDRLTHRLAHVQKNDEMLAVIFIDLDRFKFINDSLGHNVGDMLLKEVAHRLAGYIRQGDTLARMGGDEFTVIVSDITKPEDTAIAAQRVLQSFSEPFLIDGHEMFVSPSMGISTYPCDGLDVETLVKSADTAMYRAKEQGRNNFQFYTKGLNSAAMEKMTLETNLRRAIEREELMLYYQQKVQLDTGMTLGAEALIRWKHPNIGMVSPAQFIPLAEECGLILPISDWVLRTACAQNKAWQDQGFPAIGISVNISARQFQDRDLIESVKNALDTTGLDPMYLELEITESMLVKNPDLASSFLNQLKSMGVRISIDDFGTGYSSLSYLKKLPIDAVKIDQSFVKDITANPDDAAIASAVVAMAHSMKLEVVAEGVETLEQLEFLRSIECDQVQGYFIGRPMPVGSFTDTLCDSMWDAGLFAA
ncbi:MAG: EAL domain-containing protein [Armatimonadota bacterium]